MDGQIDVDDEDFVKGNLEAVVKVLQVAGLKSAILPIDGVEAVMVSAGSQIFHIISVSQEYPGASHFVFVAMISDVRLNLSDVNYWNMESIGVTAILDQNGNPRLSLMVLREHLSALGFGRYVGLWLASLARFHSWLIDFK